MKDKNEFDIKKLISRFLDHWKLYVICMLVFILLGFLFINYTTPLYKVDSKILIQDDQGQESAFGTPSSTMMDFSSLFDVKNNIYNELTILQTRDLLKKVVQDLNLNVTYYKVQGPQTIELYDKSPFNVQFTPVNDSVKSTTFDIEFNNSGKGNQFSVKSEDLDTAFNGKFNDSIRTSIGTLYFTRNARTFENTAYELNINSIRSAAGAILDDMTADLTDVQTSVIDLSYNTNVPRKGEDIIRTLIAEYTNRNLSEKNRISDSSLAFINSRINLVSTDLNDIESRIQNFKQHNNLADISEQSRLLVNNASTSLTDLNNIEVQLDVARNTLSYVQDVKNNKRPIPALLTNDPTFLSLVQTYNALLVQQDRVSLSVSEINPIAQNVETQINSVRANIIKSLQSQIKALEISKNQIQAQTGAISGEVRDVPAQEREYVNLSREQGMKQALYTYLLQKKEETAITKAASLSNAVIIESPASAAKPYFPNPVLIYALSIILGFLFPTSIVILKYIANSRINTVDDIKSMTDTPILAEIGHSNKIGLLSLKEEGRSMLAEQFRVFRSNMNFLISQKQCPVILLTSSMSGEGKSFISANLGQIYAVLGKKVLLMEMDLRKPHISKVFGKDNSNGFSNFITSDASNSVLNYVQALPDIPNAYLLSSGIIPPNPAELLSSPRVDIMMKELKEQFDMIIIDSPPIGLVTDAQILTKYADVNLFLVRERYSYKNSLQMVDELLESKKFSNLYIVVNDVLKGASHRYGYGYGYGHGYYGSSNGYYIDGMPKKKTLLKRIFSKA